MDKKSRIWVIVLALLLAVALVLLVIFKLRIDRLETEQPVPVVTDGSEATVEPTAETAVDMDAINSRIDGLADTLTELKQHEAGLQQKIAWIEYELSTAAYEGSDNTALNDAKKALGDVGYLMNGAESVIYSAKNQIAAAGSGITVDQYAAMTNEMEQVEAKLEELSGGLEAVDTDVSAVLDEIGLVYPGDGSWQIPSEDEQWNEMMQVLETVAAERDYYYAEFEAVAAELETAESERDTAAAERDTVAAELETVTAERDAAVTGLENATAERDAAQEAYAGAAEELEQLRTELDEAGSANIDLGKQLEEAQALLKEYAADGDTIYHASADMENVVGVASDGISAVYELANNDMSGNNIRCELALDGKVIYTSGDIAPGGSLEPFALESALTAGEYGATLTIITLNAEGDVSSRISLPVTVAVAE